MAKYCFKVNIDPDKAASLIKEDSSADIIHEEYISLQGGTAAIILVFEKYYMRVEGTGAMTVIIENSKRDTFVKVIPAGVSKGMIFNFDWGASDDFAASVRDAIKDYIIEEYEIE